MVEQLVQIVGALLVLVGFALAQFGWLDQHSVVYLTVNLLGSTILAVDAVVSGQLGFLLLEGVWALVSAWGLMGTINSCAERASSRAFPRAARPREIRSADNDRPADRPCRRRWTDRLRRRAGRCARARDVALAGQRRRATRRSGRHARAWRPRPGAWGWRARGCRLPAPTMGRGSHRCRHRRPGRDRSCWQVTPAHGSSRRRSGCRRWNRPRRDRPGGSTSRLATRLIVPGADRSARPCRQ
jgi:hypothetical protein